MNEVVKYHNDLNTITLGGLTENQQNLLFTIFAKIRDKDTTEIKFDINELIEFTGISTTNKSYLETAIFGNLDKLQNLKIRYETDKTKAQKVIFPEVELNKDTDELFVKVNKSFSYIFNELTSNFTRFELAEFVSLSGKYKKTLYRLLKQYRTTGFLNMEWKKFNEIMDIPPKMALRDIEKRVLKPAIKELSSERNLFDQKRTPFKKLGYNKLKQGKGNKITHIEFYFEPEKYVKEIIEQEDEKQTEAERSAIEFSNLFAGKKFVSNNETMVIRRASKQEDEKIKVLAMITSNSEYQEILFKNLEQLVMAIAKYDLENPIKTRS